MSGSLLEGCSSVLPALVTHSDSSASVNPRVRLRAADSTGVPGRASCTAGPPAQVRSGRAGMAASGVPVPVSSLETQPGPRPSPALSDRAGIPPPAWGGGGHRRQSYRDSEF